MNLWESIYGVITGTVEEHLKIQFPVMSMHSGMLQFSSVTQSCLTLATPWTSTGQASQSITDSWSLLKHVHWVGDAIQPSHPLLSSSPPAFNLSQLQGLFQWGHIRWPKYWSFSFSISPSNEYSGLISFRMDWLGLLAVQGTLKSLLQHQKHQFFSAQLYTILYGPTLTSILDY